MESTARRVAASDTSLESQLDSLSLEQALIDFERANARVIDLTQRLLEASDEVIELKEKLRVARDELEAVRYENEMIKSSRPFKLLVSIRGVRDFLRR
jgi:predicted  nucleic acid-binding Zn-ribbon protein